MENIEKKEKKLIQNKEDFEIDLQRLFAALMCKAWLIVIISLITGLIAFGWSKLVITPLYESEAMFYVNNRNLSTGSMATENLSSSDLSTSRSLVESYKVILMTDQTLLDVADYAKVDYSKKELSKMISATAVNDTEIFKVTVTSADPKEAEKIANAIENVLPKRISHIIEGTTAQIVDHANIPTEKSSPSNLKNTIIGVMIGFIATFGVICLYEIFNVKIRSEEDVEQCCKYPVLSVVPDMRSGSKGAGYYQYGSKDMEKRRKRKRSKKFLETAANKGDETAFIGNNLGFSAAEAYKLLGTKVQFSFADDQDSHVISVSSSLPGEGKSLTSINLAHSLSTLNKKVLLVDGDLRKPSVAAKLGIQMTPGLSNYLVRQKELREVIQELNLNGDVRIDVIAAGDIPPNAVELLSSDRMSRLMEELRKMYDVIILDLPPVKEVSDAMVVSGVSDGVLFVTRENYCDRILLASSIKQFEFINAKILGVILNCSKDKDEKHKKYGKYYGSYYGNAYGSAAGRKKK